LRCPPHNDSITIRCFFFFARIVSREETQADRQKTVREKGVRKGEEPFFHTEMYKIMGRMIRPATHRTRFVILAFVVIVYFNYVISPEFGDGGSSFKLNHPGSSPSGLGTSSSGRKGGEKEEGPRYGNPIQFDFKGSGRTAGDGKRAKEIKETMRRTFWKYRLGAWGSDEIMPISGDGKTTRWGCFFFPHVLFLEAAGACLAAFVPQLSWGFLSFLFPFFFSFSLRLELMLVFVGTGGQRLLWIL